MSSDSSGVSEKLLTTNELARYLNVSYHKILIMRQEEGFPFHLVGKQARFNRLEVLEYFRKKQLSAGGENAK